MATGQDAYRATNRVDPLDRQVVGVGNVDETVGPDRDRCRPAELRPGRGAGQDGDRWTGVGRWRDQPRHSDDRHQGENCKRGDRHQPRRNLHPAPGRRYKRHADCWPSGVPDGDLGSAVDSELLADVLQVTRRSAIARLVRPSATRAATSCSRRLSGVRPATSRAIPEVAGDLNPRQTGTRWAPERVICPMGETAAGA